MGTIAGIMAFCKPSPQDALLGKQWLAGMTGRRLGCGETPFEPANGYLAIL
jgi:hypothetical protein